MKEANCLICVFDLNSSMLNYVTAIFGFVNTINWSFLYSLGSIL